jgi:hypothetical protein
MSKNVKNESESPAIIEEIIPGKNTDYSDKSLNKNNNNDEQQFIENYNEQESAQAVIDASEESTVRNTNESANQIPRHSQSTAHTQEQSTQTTREISENYLGLQRQAIDSFQSAFVPYFQNFQNQLWSNQEYFKSLTSMYSRLASNYAESVMALSRMWNDIAFTNASLFNTATNKPKR